jgi:carboxymethylenebutenolidase
MPTVTIDGAHVEMSVYVATPSTDGPWPGVIVISDALGMTTDLRNQADWLAGECYLAAAPDIYYWGGRIRCMFSLMRQALAREGQIFDDLDVIRTWLSDNESCSGRIGVIGFCLGGGFALLLAGTGGYQASSVNYGTVPKDAETLLAGACPIVAGYGARDPTLRKAPALLEQVLSANGVPHDIKVYDDAGHAFINDHDPADEPRWAMIAGSMSRSGYHEPSAIDARRRIVAFFGTHLRRQTRDT